MIEVDVRGYSCPIPVVRTRQTFDEHPTEAITVLVDSEVSRENVSRLAESRGYSVKQEKVSDGYHLLLILQKK